MTLTVNGSVKYDIMIEGGILEGFGEVAARIFQPSRVVIITDTNVEPLYAAKLSNSLETAGFEVFGYVFEAGENQKNLKTFENIITFLIENSINKGDLLVALGGGVVSDLVGFVASCYLRGMPYATVTTTLLAAVDASIGGKTAVDHAGQKNNIGAFYPPHFVMCDTDLLGTLPLDELNNGLVEAIKSAILLDPELFDYLSKKQEKPDYSYIIERSLLVKRHYVEQDERDNGLRQLLNLGHTLAHAIEAESGYSIPHGRAVAAGLLEIVRCSEYHGLTEKGLADNILNVFSTNGINSTLPYPIETLLPHLVNDKKARKSSLTLALVRAVGDPFLHKIEMDELKQFFIFRDLPR